MQLRCNQPESFDRGVVARRKHHCTKECRAGFVDADSFDDTNPVQSFAGKDSGCHEGALNSGAVC
jgi:hypothetical protein